MSEPDTNIAIGNPAEIAILWRKLTLAIATLLAVLIAVHRLDSDAPLTAAHFVLLAIELTPCVIVALLVRAGARKRVVVAMLFAMTYVAHAALVAASPDSRWLGTFELLVAMALFGALFVVGRELLAEERRLNP